MRITCPQCGFFRELPDNKIPVTSTKATCPKCGHRFKFRPDHDAPTAGGLREREPVSAPQDGISSWRRSGPAPSTIDLPTHPGNRHLEPEAYDDGVSRHEPPGREHGRYADSDPAATPPPSSHAADPQPEPYPEDAPPTEAYYRSPRVPGSGAGRRSLPGGDDPEEAPAPQDLAEAYENHRHRAECSQYEERADVPPPPEDDQEAAPRQNVPEQPPADPACGQGTDGVRDIWARLKAMDAPTRKRAADSRQTPRQEKDAQEVRDTPRETVTDPIPWERLDAYGFLPGLFLTLRKILFTPLDFFGAMPEGRPKGKALVFNLLISEFLLVIDFLWTLTGLRGRIGDPAGQADALGAVAATPGLGFLIALLLVPLAIACGIYLDAWLTHLLLLLFRSAKKSFNETFRVMCYSAAPTVLSAVPVAGQILSPVILVWYMALQAIGLKKVHDAAYTQTLAAIFIKWSLYLFLLLAMLQNFAPGH